MTDEEIRLRLPDLEDAWTERKTAVHSDDFKKTLVAFANSVPDGEAAIVYVGVDNDGKPIGVADAEKTQTSIKRLAEERHPEVTTRMRVISVESKSIIAVVISASHDRPHFAAAAYVRKGHESIKASDSQFKELVASRTSAARPILEAKYNGEDVLVSDYQMGRMIGCVPQLCSIVECTPVYAVFL